MTLRTKINSTELQHFSYYSGSQISIWFGDIWVNDINSITWQYNQEKRPLYGYASQHFDAVAKGQVLIQGSFVVNFRQKDYISFVIKNLPALYNDVVAKAQTEKDRWEAIRPIVSTHLRNGTFGPSTNAEIAALAQSENFWEDVDLYERAIWGELYETDKLDTETPDVIQNRIKPNGFDITVSYGNNLAYESKNLYEVLSSTTKTLNGVHLTGTSQVIQANGEPIQEVYSFFAKDMDKVIGKQY